MLPKTEIPNKETGELFDNLIDIHSLAKALSVHARTIYALIYRDEIPYYRIGGAYRFDLSEVREKLRRKEKNAINPKRR